MKTIVKQNQSYNMYDSYNEAVDNIYWNSVNLSNPVIIYWVDENQKVFELLKESDWQYNDWYYSFSELSPSLQEEARKKGVLEYEWAFSFDDDSVETVQEFFKSTWPFTTEMCSVDELESYNLVTLQEFIEENINF